MPLYKNKKWLTKKYKDEKLSPSRVSKLCNVCSTTIVNWLKRHNIPFRSISEANHITRANHCDLSKEAIKWINGELLGDGCLQSKSKYSAKFEYGSKHIEYIEYVRDTLKSFGIEQAGKIYKQKNKKYGNIGYHYRSRAYVELLPICKQWYPYGKKIIPSNITITPLTLRQHYIGDGCLQIQKKQKPNICLATNGFTIQDVNTLSKQLNNLGFKAKRQPSKNAIGISVHSVKNFLKYIGECPVKCYQYKWEY